MRGAAFTLAEVLITLGIIGIVSALTIPTLVQNYKKRVASTRIKNFYSMMSQAVILSERDNGEAQYWEKSPSNYSENSQIINGQNAYDFFMKYLAPYIKYVSIDKAEKTENPEDMKSYEARVIFADSSVVYMHNGDCLDMNFDYKGSRKPNAVGKDVFSFLLCTDKSKLYKTNGKIFSSYMQYYVPTRVKALAQCRSVPTYCSVLLMYDGWEFKSDYPYKL